MNPGIRLLVAVSLGVILLATLFVAVPYWLLTRDGMVEISVREGAPSGDQVNLRVPASLVRLAAVFVPRIRPGIDDPEVLGALAAAQAVLEQMEDAPDAVYVAVDEPGTRVRIAKQGGRFVVEVDDDGDRVRISIPSVAVRVLVETLPRLAAVPAEAVGT